MVCCPDAPRSGIVHDKMLGGCRACETENVRRLSRVDFLHYCPNIGVSGLSVERVVASDCQAYQGQMQQLHHKDYYYIALKEQIRAKLSAVNSLLSIVSSVHDTCLSVGNSAFLQRIDYISVIVLFLRRLKRILE